MDKPAIKIYAMDVVERGNTSLKKAINYWNILVTSFLNHLNGKTRSMKVGPQGMLIEHEDEAMVTWVLNMQKVGLFVNIQQLKMKVVEITETKPTPFQSSILRDNWWF
jgi:hypothetical protein